MATEKPTQDGALPDEEMSEDAFVAWVERAMGALVQRFDDVFDTEGLTPPGVGDTDFEAMQRQLLAALREEGLAPPGDADAVDRTFVRDQGVRILSQLTEMMGELDDGVALPVVTPSEGADPPRLDLSKLLGAPDADEAEEPR